MSFDSVCGVILIFLSVSCSIKEDRSSCPSVVEIVARAGEDFGEEGVIAVAGKDGRELACEKGSDRCYVEIPGSGEDVFVWYGRNCSEGMVLGGYDERFSELYYGRTFLTWRNGVDTIRLSKDYSRLEIHLKNGMGSDILKREYEVELTGGVCGYDPFGNPLVGEYKVNCQLDRIYGCIICVPRQVDDSLNIKVRSSEGVVRNFPLGTYLAYCGFDWNAEELADARIDIDYESSAMTITTDQWFRTISFKVVF